MCDQQRWSQEQWYSALAQAKDDGIELGVAKGIEQGKNVGALAKSQEIVRNMFKNGFDLQAIQLATNLTEPEIRSLLQTDLV